MMRVSAGMGLLSLAKSVVAVASKSSNDTLTGTSGQDSSSTGNSPSTLPSNTSDLAAWSGAIVLFLLLFNWFCCHRQQASQVEPAPAPAEAKDPVAAPVGLVVSVHAVDQQVGAFSGAQAGNKSPSALRSGSMFSQLPGVPVVPVAPPATELEFKEPGVNSGVVSLQPAAIPKLS